MPSLYRNSVGLYRNGSGLALSTACCCGAATNCPSVCDCCTHPVLSISGASGSATCMALNSPNLIGPWWAKEDCSWNTNGNVGGPPTSTGITCASGYWRLSIGEDVAGTQNKHMFKYRRSPGGTCPYGTYAYDSSGPAALCDFSNAVVTVAAATFCSGYECSATPADVWVLGNMGMSSATDYCLYMAEMSGAHYRHLKWGTYDVYVPGSEEPYWLYNDSWGYDLSNCTAAGGGNGAGPFGVTVTNDYGCSYTIQCSPPALEINTTASCP